MKIVAIMIVRNEQDCLPRCLEHLGEQGLTTAVVDNDSTDRTRAILEASGIVERIDHAPFDGTFRWGDLLQKAHAMQQEIAADWFHLNSPDEICNSDRPGERLVDAIARIDAAGCTAINYDEFVFLPTDERTHGEGKAFDRLLRHYYFYAPRKLHQMRSWKNVPGISNVESGGHRLAGPDLRVWPENLPLRHYIAISADHFRAKYRHRKFPEEELARGWHGDRAIIDAERVRMPSPRLLKRLDGDDVSRLDRSEVWMKHFWETERPLSIKVSAIQALSNTFMRDLRSRRAAAPPADDDRCPCGSGRKFKNCHGRAMRGARGPAPR